MTDAVLEILIDPSGAEAGAARAVRALDDIRARAAAAEGGLADLGRGLEAGGDAIARSLDAAARGLSEVERAAAGLPGGDGSGLFDGLLAGGARAADGLLGILGRLAGDVGRMFGSGGALDLHSAFGNLGRAAATGFQSILPAGLGFLGPVAALAGGALGGWLGSLFQRPPKVPQGEYSVWLSDPATPQYASTRFPSVTDAAQGVTTDLTRLVVALEQGLGVRRSDDPGAAIGATLNEKEGLRLFYDAGAGDGPDAAGRAWFQADPGNQAAVEAARQERRAVGGEVGRQPGDRPAEAGLDHPRRRRRVVAEALQDRRHRLPFGGQAPRPLLQATERRVGGSRPQAGRGLDHPAPGGRRRVERGRCQAHRPAVVGRGPFSALAGRPGAAGPADRGDPGDARGGRPPARADAGHGALRTQRREYSAGRATGMR